MTMDHTGLFFCVAGSIGGAPLRDYLWHGYESRDDFRDDLRRLVLLWQDRTGECMEERNGFLRLRFHDTPGGVPDEAWLPLYLLRQTAAPPYMAMRSCESGDDEASKAADEAFGFD